MSNIEKIKENIKAEIEQELVEGRLVPIRVDDWMNDYEKEEETMWLEWCENVDYLAYCSIARHFAEWMRRKMMKEAVEGEVVQDAYSRELRAKTKDLRKYNLKFGDKIKLIIIKD